MFGIRKIMLKDMTHHIRNAGRNLKLRNRAKQRRVDDREHGTNPLAIVAALLLQHIVAQNTAVARLAAGGGKGQHAGNGQRAAGFEIVLIDFPEVDLRIFQSQRDGLAGVDDRPAANAEHEIHPFQPPERNALHRQFDIGVCDHSA
ncbi:hypothetical protein SDC9_171371 [bioreactor metagenome]|uniref:Uncharacterized protein n=1 Tax=bioreactor metagenome TaxID=1076179 RepID=A0A645GAN8_9ZZZZ